MPGCLEFGAYVKEKEVKLHLFVGVGMMVFTAQLLILPSFSFLKLIAFCCILSMVCVVFHCHTFASYIYRHRV